MVKIVISLILLLAISSSSISENPEEFEWGNLKNLGPNINSPGKDEHVTFTGDGKTMYFASIREGGMGAAPAHPLERRTLRRRRAGPHAGKQRTGLL